MPEKTIFKKIIDKEIPAYIIYEDESFLVFLDIFPRSLGHALVIPKQEVRWVWEAEQYNELFELARRVAKAQQTVFDTELIRLDVIGDEVPHAHIHVRTDLPLGTEGKNFEMLAEKMKKALS